MRESGYYWLKDKESNITGVALWDSEEQDWSFAADARYYSDEFVLEHYIINENKIKEE